MADRMVQQGLGQIPSSSQFVQMPNSAAEAAVAVARITSAPRPRPQPHHPAVVPNSPENLVIRNLKKRMDRLGLNAHNTPSSARLTTGQSGATATTTATDTATAAAITYPVVNSSISSTYNGASRNNDNSFNSKKSSKRNEKDRNWKNGPPATLAPLLHPSSHQHEGQENLGGGGRIKRHEGSVGNRQSNGLFADGSSLAGDGGGSSGTTAGSALKGIGKGTGVRGGGAIVGGRRSRMTTAESITAIGGNGGGVGGGNRRGNGGQSVNTGGGGGVSQRRRKKEKEGGQNRSKRVSASHHITHHNNQGGWAPSVVDDRDYGMGQGGGYPGGHPGSVVGVGPSCGRTGCSTVAETQEPGSNLGLQYNHLQDHDNRHPNYQHFGYQHQHQSDPKQLIQHQQQQQYYQANQAHSPGDVQQSFKFGQHQAHQQQHQRQQGEQHYNRQGEQDKTIRSSFLQGIKTHALQPTQLTHLTLLRYEFFMNEFVEMMRLLPALQVLDIDIVSIPSCSCRTLVHPHGRQKKQKHQHSHHYHRRHQPPRNGSQSSPNNDRQAQDPSLGLPGYPYRNHPHAAAPHAWHSSQNDDSDDMDIDSEENNPSSTATLCSNCIRREGLFHRNHGNTSASGLQDQFPTVRSLTFRGTAIVPELLALFPNLETLAFEEMRYKTPSTAANPIAPPSVPGDALFHRSSTHSQAYSQMRSSQGEFSSSSFYTESGDDSLDATASLSLEAGLPISQSRQSVMISELAMMLKNHCPLLTRLVLNEPLLVEDFSPEPRTLSSTSVGRSVSPVGSSQSYIYPASQEKARESHVQDQLAQLLQVVPRLKQFVAHSRVVAKCPRLLETLLEFHHPHLVSFQVLDDSQDMSHYPSIQNPHMPAAVPNQPQHHAFYSKQDIYDQQSPHQQQQLYQEQGHQYQSTFVPHGSGSPTQQPLGHQPRRMEGSGYGGFRDPSSSPPVQPASLLHQTLQEQHQAQQLQRQQNMIRLQTSCFQILESCPSLQVFESKIPLPLQQLIGSVPRWACGPEITVLWLEIQELTGNSGLDPEEEEVMQMFVRSLFKGSRSNTVSSSSPPQDTAASSGSGDGSSSRPTTASPSPSLLPTDEGMAEVVSAEMLSPGATKETENGSSFLEMGSGLRPESGFESGGLSRTESSILSSATIGETFQAVSPPSVQGLPPFATNVWPTSEVLQQKQQQSVSSVPAPAVNEAKVPNIGGIASGWNKSLLPPPPPLAFTSLAATSSTMGSYSSGYQIEGIERLVALQFLVEHQLVYLPKLDRFLVGNRIYTIPTRERVV